MAVDMKGDARPMYVKFSFHPTFNVPTLDEAEEFFQRVFGLPSVLMQTIPDDQPVEPGRPRGYSKFVMIRDVLIDNVCPALHPRALPNVSSPRLVNIGWYCDDITATFRALRVAGIPLANQIGEPAEGDEPPDVSQGGGGMKMFFTPAPRVGLRYQFLPTFPLAHDPRLTPGWVLPPVSPQDPLGIERLSHHVILSDDPSRAVHFMQVLGGGVVREGRDDVRGITGPYVRLADAIYHFAVPNAGVPGADILAKKTPADHYLALTFKVQDLGRVADHLGQVGVKVASRTGDTIITDPGTSLGTPWGFTTADLPGDH